MTQPKEKGHILKPRTKREFLPPLQKRILLCLAKTHPQTINETKEAINGHYKSTWTAFNSLKRKEIIAEIGKKEYRGNEYPCFWLTDAGAFIALIEGINPNTLLNRALEIYPENKVLHCVIEVSTVLGTEMYEIAYFAVLTKGRIEKSDVSAMLSSQLQKDMSMEQIGDLISIMKKYPEQFGNFEDQIDEMTEKLGRIALFLKDAK